MIGSEGCTALHVRRLKDDEIEQVGAVLGLARLHQATGFYLIAWESGEPLGHAYLSLTNPPELQDVFVRLEQRRRGIAKLLTAAAEQNAVTCGFHRLRLEVSADDSVAQALYQSCGFSDAGLSPRRVKGTIMIRTGPIDVDDTLLIWEKSLDPQEEL